MLKKATTKKMTPYAAKALPQHHLTTLVLVVVQVLQVMAATQVLVLVPVLQMVPVPVLQMVLVPVLVPVLAVTQVLQTKAAKAKAAKGHHLLTKVLVLLQIMAVTQVLQIMAVEEVAQGHHLLTTQRHHLLGDDSTELCVWTSIHSPASY
jgi:hypothetical protein